MVTIIELIGAEVRSPSPSFPVGPLPEVDVSDVEAITELAGIEI